MTVNEAVARGYNFFVVAFLGIIAGSLVGELAEEGTWLLRLDELLVIAVGVVATVWYLRGSNRYQRSILPVALVLVAFVAKLVGLLIEFKYVLEVGDDYTLLGVLLLLLIVSGVAYYQTRPARLDAEASGTRAAHEASHMPSRAGR